MQLARFHRLRPNYYRLEGTRCPECETKHFPPRTRCNQCGSKDIESIRLARRGKAVAITHIHQPARGFRQGTGVMAAIVDLTDGVRLIGQLTDIDPKETKVGMEVEMVVRRLRPENEDEMILYGYKFRPVLKSS